MRNGVELIDGRRVRVKAKEQPPPLQLPNSHHPVCARRGDDPLLQTAFLLRGGVVHAAPDSFVLVEAAHSPEGRIDGFFGRESLDHVRSDAPQTQDGALMRQQGRLTGDRLVVQEQCRREAEEGRGDQLPHLVAQDQRQIVSQQLQKRSGLVAPPKHFSTRTLRGSGNPPP